ncbi:MAG TPA: DUF3826 domain-containing protein [Verrucomicrobia bacterium]|nr:DUF3826 domain-containing protein [Verrucomicrobiota bacterium]HOP98834.1 DUF3826 domain-containing protein [Verrucomicrobiota bacterium]
MKTRILLLAVWCAAALAAPGQESSADTDAEAAYTRTINERAAKIVDTLGLTNADQATRVRAIIARQYRDLRTIHDERDAAIRQARQSAGDKAAVDAAVRKLEDEARVRSDKLHGEYLARLSAELSPEQVDKVKDGMTYGVLEVTYNAYLKMFPDLTAEQKKQIRDWLVEAREIAMDQGSSNEKHAIFNKYKGRINNYLVRAGYDLKKGEENLRRN